MTAAELNAAADLAEAHPDALAVLNRLDRFDQETRICRGESTQPSPAPVGVPAA